MRPAPAVALELRGNLLGSRVVPGRYSLGLSVWVLEGLEFRVAGLDFGV